MPKFGEPKKEVEVFGPSLIEIKGMMYRGPEGNPRGIWQLPEDASHGMMFMLWWHLAMEILKRMPKDAPIRPVVQETVTKINRMMATYKPD